MPRRNDAQQIVSSGSNMTLERCLSAYRRLLDAYDTAFEDGEAWEAFTLLLHLVGLAVRWDAAMDAHLCELIKPHIKRALRRQVRSPRAAVRFIYSYTHSGRHKPAHHSGQVGAVEPAEPPQAVELSAH
jgi:hypothetical protein